MVQILPEAPSFGTQIARGLGLGAQQGVSQASQFAQQLALEKAKTNQRQKMLQSIVGQESQTPMMDKTSMENRFLEALPEIEQLAGRELTPQDLNQLWQELSQGQPKVAQPRKDGFAIAEKLALAGEPEIARVYTEREKVEREHQFKKEESEVARAHEESKPTRARGRELLEDLPYKENALATMKEAIQSENLGFFSLDNLADMTGIEGLRSPEGAAFKTSAKEFFLGNLSRVGSRGLNQMMEKVVLEMSPLIGRSTEANLAVTEILGAENDVSRKEAELIHDIGQTYKEKHGHYPEDLADRVYKELRPYATQRQKDALAQVDKVKQLYEPKNKQGVLMYDPQGNLRRIPHKDRKAALKEGYRTP